MSSKYLLPVALLLLATMTPSAQQTFPTVGPRQCLNCHDHEAESAWYQKKEIPEVQRLFPEKGANAGHINSLKQMETPKSDEYAKAIGLADKYDAKGACVACHATVYAGDANAGVSCESCHGPAGGYLKPHETKDSYEQMVAQFGMTRLVGNLRGWTQQCTNCHVMTDERLIKAGHASGDDFDLSKKFLPVSLHFKKMYTPAEVAAVARPEMEGILRMRRGGAAPAAPPASSEAPVAAGAPAAASPASGAATGAAATSPATAGTTAASAPGAAEPTPPPASTSLPPEQPVAVREARPRAINLSAPPAGSPTSIEPPTPPAAETAASLPTAAAAPAASAAAPAVAVTTVPSDASGWLQTNWVLLGVGALVGGVAIVLVLRRKSRR